MKRFFLIPVLSLMLLSQGWAQPFTRLNTTLVQVSRGAVVFADFDNDNDLDLFIAGQNSSYEPVAKLYLNQEGIFTEAECGIEGMYNCAAAVADYDGDGFMDIVITGEHFNGMATRLYRNTGNGQFEPVDAGFFAAGADGDLAWADYNNDGYPDLLISGSWQTKLYKNNGNGTFSHIETGLPGMNSPSVSWGDFNNDGFPDLLLAGDAGSVADAFVYINHRGNFSLLDQQIEGAVGGAARWGDFDNDGLPDILISGKDFYLTPVAYVYRNNGDNTFSFINAGLTGTALGPADWIDFNNDGSLDIMLAGQNSGCGNVATRLYRNNGNGTFTELPAGLAYAEKAASAWGDFDNDGDYDLVLTGLSGNNITHLYRNDLLSGNFQPNTPPSVPEGFYTYVSDDYALISWEPATDAQSPATSLTYNIMVGTEPGGVDVISPMASPETGRRYVPEAGNCGLGNFTELRNLQPGTYYYRVQAIDQAYAGSEFSEEGSFTILATAAKSAGHAQLRYRTENDVLYVSTAGAGTGSYAIYDLQGRRATSGTSEGSELKISLKGLSPGFYLLQLNGNGRHEVLKFFRP